VTPLAQPLLRTRPLRQTVPSGERSNIVSGMLILTSPGDLAWMLILQNAALTLVVVWLLVLAATHARHTVPNLVPYHGGAVELHPDVGYTGGSAILAP
jgi:hypothetical protein